MQQLLSILAVIWMVIFCAWQRAEAWEPVGFPYQTWGEASYGELEGMKMDTYIEQGIDWFRLGNSRAVLNTFGGVRLTLSDRSEDTWNNKGGPVLGIKLKYDIMTATGHWNQLTLGARAEYVSYFTTHRNTLHGLIFLQWGFGGNWKAQHAR